MVILPVEAEVNKVLQKRRKYFLAVIATSSLPKCLILNVMCLRIPEISRFGVLSVTTVASAKVR